MPPGYVALPGSEHRPPAGSRVVGPVPPQQRITATLIVRRKAALPPPAAVPLAPGDPAPAARLPVSRADFAARYGADPADLARIETFARAHGLLVGGTDAARRSVTLAGPAAAFARAFGVDVQLYQLESGDTCRGFSGPIWIPAELAGVIEAVLGLDDLPAARPR